MTIINDDNRLFDTDIEKKEKMYLCNDSLCSHCMYCQAISDDDKIFLKGIINKHEEKAIVVHASESETILETAAKHWGIDIYLGQTGEEAAELIKELAELIQNLNHYKRNRTNSFDKLIVEMAHVKLMLEIMQLLILPGEGGKQLFQEIINHEILRIRKKYKSDNQNIDHIPV